MKLRSCFLIGAKVFSENPELLAAADSFAGFDHVVEVNSGQVAGEPALDASDAARDTFPAMSDSVQWGKVIDQTCCIGCHACSTACKSENAVPLGVNRTYVKYVDVGQFPAARRAFQV